MLETVILAFVGVLLLLVLVWLIVFFKSARDVRLGRHVEKARKRMKDPATGTLTVTGIDAPSPEAVWKMTQVTGVVSAPGLEPRPVQRLGLMRTAFWPKPGDVLPIVVDRAKPDFYVVEWTKVKRESEAAWDEAQRLAAEMKSGAP